MNRYSREVKLILPPDGDAHTYRPSDNHHATFDNFNMTGRGYQTVQMEAELMNSNGSIKTKNMTNSINQFLPPY